MRMAKLVKYLPQNGWQVTVLCSDEQRPLIEDHRLLAEIPSSVRILRIRGPLHRIGGSATGAVADAWKNGRATLVTRLAVNAGRAVLLPDRWVGWALAASRVHVSTLDHPDVILSSGPPHSTHLAATELSRRLRVPFVADMRDEWAGNPFDANVVPWQAWANSRLESWCMERASRVVVVSDLMRQRLVERRPQMADRVVALPNGFDPEDMVAAPARLAVGPTDPVRFLYAGRLNRQQQVGRFFERFGLFAAGTPPACSLDLLGTLDPDHVRAARASITPGAITVRMTIPHNDAVQAMARADVLVMVTTGGGAGPATMTGKLYEYLALRRPILLIGRDGAAAELVRSSGAGVAADPDDAAQIDQALARVIEIARDDRFKGASDEIVQRFDRRSLAADWSALLADVVKNARPRIPSENNMPHRSTPH
jgi:glycosyltransferase involved in cell wall biosynthesis